MGAYSELSKSFFKDIIRKAELMNYSEDNILLLKGNMDELKIKFPQTYNNLISCRHHRDMRSPLEYGRDLVASWLFEDSLVHELSLNGINIDLNGADKNRKVLSDNNVSSNSDTKVFFNGNMRQMEIMCDYTGFWNRTNQIDLRDQKFLKLKSTNSLFLGISTVDRTYILIDFSKSVSYEYIQAHKFYGWKPCYRIGITQSQFKKFKIDELINDIKKAI